MDTLIDRSWHLLPTLRYYWYAIPLRLIIGVGIGIGFVEQSQAKPARGPEPFTGSCMRWGRRARLTSMFRARRGKPHPCGVLAVP